MLELVFQADCLEEMIGGVNEAVAMLLERWGDVRLVDIREAQRPTQEQMKIGNT